jgi:predicted solute-binding protein
MSNSFEEVRRYMLSTLAKYPMRPLPKDEFDNLINKYEEAELVDAAKYLIKKGMLNPNAVSQTFDETSLSHHFLELTADGYDIATGDALGYEISAVTVKLHSNTLQQLDSIIKESNLKAEEKRKLLTQLKEKGAEYVLTRCIELLVSNAKAVGLVLAQYLKISN